jgi:rSAM/selenodomain-associated transferase 1
MEALICIFAKPPTQGEVKTRLGLAPHDAARLAQAFLDDTIEAAGRLPWAEVALASTAAVASPLPVVLQGGGDLGARIERVLGEALRRAPAAIAVGADAPALPERFLEQARAALRACDAAVGPSDDGGFYLLALKRCPSGLLEGLPWSAADTCTRTVARLRERGLRTALLEPWFDVDRPADLEKLRGLLERGELLAPRTYAVVQSLR